jgi:hypothetical protein
VSDYKPIPVDVAAYIASGYDKDIVVITAWSRQHEMTHTTTWGRSAEDKLRAADLGEVLAQAAGADLTQKKNYEDFRLDAGRLKEENDRLREQLAMLRQSNQPQERTELA